MKAINATGMTKTFKPRFTITDRNTSGLTPIEHVFGARAMMAGDPVLRTRRTARTWVKVVLRNPACRMFNYQMPVTAWVRRVQMAGIMPGRTHKARKDGYRSFRTAHLSALFMGTSPKNQNFDNDL